MRPQGLGHLPRPREHQIEALVGGQTPQKRQLELQLEFFVLLRSRELQGRAGSRPDRLFHFL